MKYSILIVFNFVIGSLWAQTKDPKDTEVWVPQPRIVTPGIQSSPPSDAIVIFDGKDLSHFQGKGGGAPKWELKDGYFTVVAGSGDISTKEVFSDIQLHIEWRSPSKVDGEGQGRGNSGIFIQDRYELQVQDNFNNKTYSNGQAGSIYKQSIPLVNASRRPGEWQSYDVLYTSPRFNSDSILIAPAYITVLHNGVVVQNHTEIKGATEYIGLPKYTYHDKGPIRLQDHGNPVSYRNIWIRTLN